MAEAKFKRPDPNDYRTTLRAKMLAGQNSTRRWKPIVFHLEDGPHTVVIRTPSLADQEAAQQACGMEFIPSADGKFKSTLRLPMRYGVEMLVACTFSPTFGANGEVVGVGAQMFDDADKPALMAEELSGWLKELSDAITAHNNEVPEKARKNSEATPSAAPASA